jgi:hypothetical protein
LEELASFINETKRTTENASDLLKLSKQLEPKIKDLLQPQRRLVKQGSIKVFGTTKNLSTPKMRHLVVCSDLFLVTKHETEFFGGSDVFYLQLYWHTGALQCALDLNVQDAGLPLEIVAGMHTKCFVVDNSLVLTGITTRLGESDSTSLARRVVLDDSQLGI